MPLSIEQQLYIRFVYSHSVLEGLKINRRKNINEWGRKGRAKIIKSIKDSKKSIES